MNATQCAPAILTAAGCTGTETNPEVRQQRAESQAAENRAKVAAGQWVVADARGTQSIIDPAYFAKSFSPMKWMQPEHVAAAKRIIDRSLPVGESVTLAHGFHPRHGVKTHTLTRLA